MADRRVTRRAVLVGGLTSALAAAAGVAVWRDADEESAHREPDTEAPDADELVDLVAPIGLAYRRLVPDEDDATRLEDLLPTMAGLDAASALEALPALAVEIEADFAEGRTIDVDGWVLSRTEARAAALISLSPR